MQISSNYSMNGVPYENRCRQKDIPEFSTERAKQENKNINPYMEDTDYNEKAFDMIGPNAPQDDRRDLSGRVLFPGFAHIGAGNGASDWNCIQ